MTAVIASLLFAGCSFFVMLVIYAVLLKASQKYQEHYIAKSASDLSDMLLFIEPRQILVLSLASMLLLGLFAYLLVNPLVAIGAVIFGFFLPNLFVKYYRKRRITRFNVQLVEALQNSANAFKAGLTLQQAIEQISKNAQAPLQQEFELFVKEMKVGVPLEQAMTNMAQRVGSDDLNLVATATNISRELGGNMAEMYETLASTIRERFRLEGKINSLTSQGKMQGWIVAAMPLLLGVALNYMRPDLMQPMLNHIFGYVLIATIILFETIGILIIRRIVNIDI